MLDDGRMFGQGAQDMRLNPVFVLLRPTRVALAKGTAIRPLFDSVLADGVGEHLGRKLVGSSEVDLVSKIQEKDISLFPTAHRRDVGGG
jgi:hypothetical protein